jgi:hypothetical protein
VRCPVCQGRGGWHGTQTVRGYAEDVFADCECCKGTGRVTEEGYRIWRAAVDAERMVYRKKYDPLIEMLDAREERQREKAERYDGEEE